MTQSRKYIGDPHDRHPYPRGSMAYENLDRTVFPDEIMRRREGIDMITSADTAQQIGQTLRLVDLGPVTTEDIRDAEGPE